jgi:Uma2 family endonuclease
MIAVTEKALEHVVLHDISWETYESIQREIGASHYRLTYNEGDLEIMTLSFGHENAGSWLGRLIFFLALEFQMDLCSGGATTLKRGLRKMGLEPDECFWIAHEKQMRGKKEWDAASDPPPDLAVEIDLTHSSVDRMGIYAALRIAEVWRLDGQGLTCHVLRSDGVYEIVAHSRAFPRLKLAEVEAFMALRYREEDNTIARMFREWVRTNLLPPGPKA